MPVPSRGTFSVRNVRPATVVIAAVLTVFAFTLSGCGGGSELGPGSGAPAPTATPSVQGSAPSIFASTDQQLSHLVTAQAAWHTPSSLRADETSRIGLSIGSSDNLNTAIQSLLPSTSTSDAGTVAIGPNVSATLEVDSDDASVSPSTAINTTTGSDVQLLWTWFLRPQHPTDDLQITAHITVALSDHTVKTADIPLSIKVDRTASYTAHQIFSAWETWVSIVTVIGGALLAVWRRRRRLVRLVSRHGAGASSGAGSADPPADEPKDQPPSPRSSTPARTTETR